MSVVPRKAASLIAAVVFLVIQAKGFTQLSFASETVPNANVEEKPEKTNRSELAEALRRHVVKLTDDIGPRTTAHGDSLIRAARYIESVFENAGLVVTRQTYAYEGTTVANVIARHRDTPADAPYYVVGAHYDTVPTTPGADDNASGVAALLELARRIAEQTPPLPVRLVAFTLEEPPAFASEHMGSRVFVERALTNEDRIRGAIVLEMVGYTSAEQDYPLFLRLAGYPDKGDFIGIVGNWSNREFTKTVARGFRQNESLPVETLSVPLNGWLVFDTRLSDHASFWDESLPAVMVTDTAYFRNPHYHEPSDTAETLDYAFMAEVVLGMERALHALAKAAP